uniref:Uncharacterized protein n=1 Tax=Aegilops tauschii subsp. strangulata TaxID=200361 RepID=A0A453QIR2_AEGTS
MAPLLSSLAASAGICVVSVLAIALLVVTLYILGTAGSFAVYCIREFTQRAHDRPPLIGTVFRQLNNFDMIFDEHVKYALLHPTIRLVYPGHSEILTADPAVIEHVLKTNFNKYSRNDGSYFTGGLQHRNRERSLWKWDFCDRRGQVAAPEEASKPRVLNQSAT